MHGGREVGERNAFYCLNQHSILLATNSFLTKTPDNTDSLGISVENIHEIVKDVKMILTIECVDSKRTYQYEILGNCTVFKL